MAQLPEVEVIRKDLEKDVVGKRFKDVTVTEGAVVRRHANEGEFIDTLTGRKIESIDRRGTALLLHLDGHAVLVVRLGARGALTRETATSDPGPVTRVVGTFTTGGSLHYADPDDDGQLFVVSSETIDTIPELARTGIDPLTETFTWVALGQRMQQRNMPLKALLVDESFIVGLGDVYSDEILWAAGLSGERLSGRLSSQEVRRLYRAVLEVLYDAVKQGGTTSPEVAEGEEDEEEVNEQLQVYNREGQPCARCRQPIRFDTVAGNDSYFCGNCQT